MMPGIKTTEAVAARENRAALRQLFSYMSEKFKFKFILTYRLNQDVLENFFSAIRAKGGLHDHPTALEFKYRLRSYLLGNLRKEE